MVKRADVESKKTREFRERIEKQKALLAELERKDRKNAARAETHQKIVLGGAVLARIRQSRGTVAEFRRLLGPVITRERDRKAFDAALGVGREGSADMGRGMSDEDDLRPISEL